MTLLLSELSQHTQPAARENAGRSHWSEQSQSWESEALGCSSESKASLCTRPATVLAARKEEKTHSVPRVRKRDGELQTVRKMRLAGLPTDVTLHV